MTRRLIIQTYIGPAEPIGDIGEDGDATDAYILSRPKPKPYDRRGR